MDHSRLQLRPYTSEDFQTFNPDSGCERWRVWARMNDRSAQYDTSSTVIRRGWFGRQFIRPSGRHHS